jgi:hypothetical protein
MEFFVPSATDPTVAEEFLVAVQSFTEDATGWTVVPGRASSLEYWEGGELLKATVGHPFQGETVECILNSDRLMLVCTANHGIGWGSPILIDKMAVATVRWFNGFGPEAVAA